MTLLLDGEARLFVIPEETGEPTARRARPTRVPAAPAPAAEPKPEHGAPVAPTPDHGAAAVPIRDHGGAAAPTRDPGPAAPTAVVPEPATWAGVHGQGRTLDDLLSETWGGLATGGAPTACPVCDGELVRRWSAGAGVVGGRCRDCGSELS